MASRKVQQLARQLFKLSFEDGQLSEERINGVLAWIDKHRPVNATAILRAYKHLVNTEIARNRAIIEFAGDLEPEAFTRIAEAMSRRYNRKVTPAPVACPDLIAGVRVRVGCDIYENSIVSQLAKLSAATS
ncbi:MAG: hypothetical protein D6781_00245 [Verrucomicrobia bacterium]|nr:MAG: hypothetical protein D6781_00245 [Verrucomicrobiota bacterium]